jgi:GT2 family glycosyltransferase
LSAPTITSGAPAFANDNPHIEASIVIISFNTRDLLRESLTSCAAECIDIPAEIFVVDNGSTDGSVEMVEAEFPQVILIQSQVNLGFGVANNLALQKARGRYFVLLNSDAFFTPGSLAKAIRHMDETPNCALGGALLQGRAGRWQPSAKRFHSVFDDLLVLTGLADKFPKSTLFGRMSRTWADESQPASVDWVPGAFAIIRPSALERVGLFDPIFFLYYEEVDLCLRLKRAGYEVWYWPDVLIIHLGGESSKKLTNLEFSTRAAQVVLWRMRSTLLYYRKHHGWKVWLAKWMEKTLYSITVLRNRWSRIPERRDRERHYRTMIRLMEQAWTETNAGRISPPRPW